MDVRGFGGGKPVSDSEAAAIEIDNYSLSFNCTAVLNNVTLSIPAGELTVLTGQTGSGKTALLESIAGLSQHFHNGFATGNLTIGEVERNLTPPRITAGLIGYVAQDVRLGFAAATAREELEFGMRVSGHTRAEAYERATELISDFSLTEFADQPIEFLSSGEATRVAIAASLALHPRILLLDEPLADLDADSRAELVTLLAELQRVEKLTIVMAEHHTSELVSLSPRWLSVVSGEIHEGKWQAGSDVAAARSLPIVGTDQTFTASNLSLTYGERDIFTDISLTLHVGEILAITGANGVGKSSLLNTLASHAESSELVRLVPEDVNSLFISETLKEELERADLLAGHTNSGLTAMTFWSILASEESPELLTIHPRDLSAGTQLALAIAIQLAWKPRVILVDEPTRGLDEVARIAMAEVLRCVSETGTAVLFASHDREFVSDLGCRVLSMQHGKLTSLEVNA
jgi:energy-coupling factor transport system ATP-binding protein